MRDPGALMNEITFVAYHLGWSLDALLDLEHADRTALVAHVERLDLQRGGRD